MANDSEQSMEEYAKDAENYVQMKHLEFGLAETKSEIGEVKKLVASLIGEWKAMKRVENKQPDRNQTQPEGLNLEEWADDEFGLGSSESSSSLSCIG
jgi:regulator of replication initiation timing